MHCVSLYFLLKALASIIVTFGSMQILCSNFVNCMFIRRLLEMWSNFLRDLLVVWFWLLYLGIFRARVTSDYTLRIENVESSDAGVYVCSANNPAGGTQATATLTVYCKYSHGWNIMVNNLQQFLYIYCYTLICLCFFNKGLFLNFNQCLDTLISFVLFTDFGPHSNVHINNEQISTFSNILTLWCTCVLQLSLHLWWSPRTRL